MDMPLRAFWSLNKQVSRLRAEEKLEQIDLFLLGNQNSDAKMIERLRASLVEKIGNAVTQDKSFVAKGTHSAGIAKLKGIRTRMREEPVKGHEHPSSESRA